MPPSPRRAHRLGAPLVLSAALATSLAACSHNTTDPLGQAPKQVPTTTTPAPTPTATTSEPATTTVPQTPEQQVTAAYLAAEAAFFDSLEHPESGGDSIQRTHGGHNLAHIEDLTASRRRENIIVRYEGGSPHPQVRNVQATESLATLDSCVVDSGIQVQADSGKVLDSSVTSMLDHVTLVYRDDRWLVTADELRKSWADGLGCRW